MIPSSLRASQPFNEKCGATQSLSDVAVVHANWRYAAGTIDFLAYARLFSSSPFCRTHRRHTDAAGRTRWFRYDRFGAVARGPVGRAWLASTLNVQKPFYISETSAACCSFVDDGLVDVSL
jgi:hypothetical protein